jgi:hypothetical protein
MKKELIKNFGSRQFEQLSDEEQVKFYHNIVQSSGRTSKKVNNLVGWMGRAGRVVLILSLLTIHINNPYDSDPFRTLMTDKVGASISWAMRFNAKQLGPTVPKSRTAIFEKKRKNFFLGKILVQILLVEGEIECCRLDKTKTYFKTNLAAGISLDKVRDNQNKEWIAIIVNDGEYYFKLDDEKIQSDWFEELEAHQRFAVMTKTREQ